MRRVDVRQTRNCATLIAGLFGEGTTNQNFNPVGERMASPGGEGEGGSDRRYRSNMQGLLQFCVDSTRAEDAEGSSGAQEMDPEVGGLSIRIFLVTAFKDTNEQNSY